jgi:hypothetical protein
MQQHQFKQPRRAMHVPRLWHTASAVALTAAAVLLGSSGAFASPPNDNPNNNTAFSFHAPEVSGGSGALTMNGGGPFNPVTGVEHAAGAFRCTSAVGSGPLAGCMAGQGTHWAALNLLRSTPFKCTATDPAGVKTAAVANDTAVLRAEFFRAGDGLNGSFTANVIVSAHDIAPDLPGIQNVWVQGVGCGTAMVHFDHIKDHR